MVSTSSRVLTYVSKILFRVTVNSTTHACKNCSSTSNTVLVLIIYGTSIGSLKNRHRIIDPSFVFINHKKQEPPTVTISNTQQQIHILYHLSITMPGIMMNSYSSSSRKTLQRSCCIRSKTLFTKSSRSTTRRTPSSSLYVSSASKSHLSTASSLSSASSQGTHSVMSSSAAPSSTCSGSSTPRVVEKTRSFDRYFASTNQEQRKSDEWGHFVHI